MKNGLGLMRMSGSGRVTKLLLIVAIGAIIAGAGPQKNDTLDGHLSPTADGNAQATGSGAEHGDPVAPVLLGIVVIILAARVGGHLFELFSQPAVLGELIVGVVLGNLSLVGLHQLEFLNVDYSHSRVFELHDYSHFAGVSIDHISRIGVILLLFQVGLETSVEQMRRVGLSALFVATIGVVIPTALGWGSGVIMLPDHHWPVHMFLGATLCATSVGITARVLKDLGKSNTKESQIILGAAVIDDVLGLVVLAVAQGVIASMDVAGGAATASFGAGEIAIIITKALGFLVAAVLLGQYISRPLFHAASFLRGRGLLLITSLAICFGFAWAADAVGLATIVGAFAAGLIITDVQYKKLVTDEAEHGLEELLQPLLDLFVPIFFVVMGLHVDLRSLADPSALGLAAVLTVAAILGKQACSLGVLEKGIDRISVGLGMIPRGEVGLIFAAVGLHLHIANERIVDQRTYSAIVVMVMATTLVTPPLLRWSLTRRRVSQ